MVRDVEGDEPGSRVAGEDTVARVEQLALGREFRAVEAPLRVLAELVPALVLRVDGLEEGVRVGGVDGDRDPEAAALGPDRVETRVVHLQQATAAVADLETELLQHLETAGAPGDRVAQLRRHRICEARLVDPRPVQLSEHREAIRVGPGGSFHHLLQRVAPAAGQDHDALQVEAIHARQQLDDRRAALAARVGHVVVDVDRGERGPQHLVRGRTQHRLWLELAQRQVALAREAARGQAGEQACSQQQVEKRARAHGSLRGRRDPGAR